MSKRLLCTIPARAGSQRLPGKNLLPMAGKPMIAHTIEAARRSACFEHIYVATEDERIAEVARAHGAEVPLLVPPAQAAGTVASHVPCVHLADWLSERGAQHDSMVCLQPTSPLRSPEDICTAVAHFREHDLDFLVSVTPIDPHYFHWAVLEDGGGPAAWHMYFGDDYMRERSELPAVHRPNGSIKLARLAPLRQVGHFFGPGLGVVETPERRSIHVATAFEFQLCEWLMTQEAA